MPRTCPHAGLEGDCRQRHGSRHGNEVFILAAELNQRDAGQPAAPRQMKREYSCRNPHSPWQTSNGADRFCVWSISTTAYQKEATQLHCCSRFCGRVTTHSVADVSSPLQPILR